MENPAASILKKIISLVPKKAVRFSYLKLCKPKPLRALADGLIRKLTPIQIVLPEGTVFLDQNDPAVSGALAMGAHDPYEIECFRNALKTDMNVVDIGANIGYYTVVAAGRVGSQGKVFAYEPESHNFSLLEKNIEANKFTWTTPIKAGLSDKPGKRILFVAEEHTGIHSFADNRGAGSGVEVETDTLDHSLESYGSPKIDLIKMDIEGAEILALQGMKQTFARNPGLILFIELYPQAIERFGHRAIELLDILKESGFTLSIIDEDKKAITPLPEAEFRSFIESFPATGEVAKNIYAVRSR
ncbi:MAG: FkbM family methyltransferase [Candidatus Paceibacterota bacterium]